MNILSPQQQRVMEELMPIAQIATDGTRDGMALLPRCHSLILGPSGSGKTYLAKKIAEQLNLPCLTLNVATWILLSNKAEPTTWTSIVDWLGALRTGGVIILDECDKLSGMGAGFVHEYTNFLRLEIHDLLDSSIPISVKMPAQPDFDGTSIPWEVPPLPWDPNDLGRFLRERVMIIGCGAWQAAWKSNGRQLGFSSGPAPAPEPPTRNQILGSIDSELRQRFRDQVSILPPMMPADFIAVAKKLALQIPQEAQAAWREHLGCAIKTAVDGNLGMRVFEELLLKSLVLARQPKTQTPENPGFSGPDPTCPTV
ncbi:MAG: ATP-binding protein [Verrucomicrobiota bacterium]